MHVDPLEGEERAVFQLIGTMTKNPKVTDEKTKQPVITRKAGLTMKGRTTVYDRFAKRTVTLMNVIGEVPVKQKDGTYKMEPQIGPVRFDKSNRIICKAENNNLYGYLMRHPANKDNKHAPKSGKKLFELVNKAHQAEKFLVSEDIELDARNLIRDAEFDTIAKIAEGVSGINLSLKPDEIRAQLAQRAKSNPKEVIDASNDVKLQRKVSAQEAVDLDLIVFDRKERVWHWNDENGADIVRVETGQDHHQVLVQFLSSPEGKKVWDKLRSQLKKLAVPA